MSEKNPIAELKERAEWAVHQRTLVRTGKFVVLPLFITCVAGLIDCVAKDKGPIGLWVIGSGASLLLLLNFLFGGIGELDKFQRWCDWKRNELKRAWQMADSEFRYAFMLHFDSDVDTVAVLRDGAIAARDAYHLFSKIVEDMKCYSHYNVPDDAIPKETSDSKSFS